MQKFSGIGYEAESDGETLTIKVNLKNKGGASGSGKSDIVATTSGNQPVPLTEGIFIGLNVYQKKPKTAA